MLIDQGDLLLDNDIAEAVQSRCQLFNFGRQRMKFYVRRDNAVHLNRKRAARERRGLLRDQSSNLDLLVHRKKVGVCGGGRRWPLSRGQDKKAKADRTRQNLLHANLSI